MRLEPVAPRSRVKHSTTEPCSGVRQETPVSLNDQTYGTLMWQSCMVPISSSNIDLWHMGAINAIYHTNDSSTPNKSLVFFPFLISVHLKFNSTSLTKGILLVRTIRFVCVKWQCEAELGKQPQMLFEVTTGSSTTWQNSVTSTESFVSTLTMFIWRTRHCHRAFKPVL